METAAVNQVVKSILPRILDALILRFGYLTKLEQNVKSLTDEMTKLKAMSDEVRERVEHGKRQLMDPRPTVVDWLRRVDAIQEGVEDIDAKHRGMRSCLLACYPDCCWLRYKLGKASFQRKPQVVELINEGQSFSDVAYLPLPAPVEVIPTRSAVGVEKVMDQILNYLNPEEQVCIIGLYGMGGVGKTTLLKNINKKFEGTQDFNHVIFVEVGSVVSVGDIQKKIYKRLGMHWSEDENSEVRAGNISQILGNYKFLLLLDNIWEWLDLNDIGVPEPNNQNKCKIILTTRKQEVCRSMGAHKTINMPVLSEADAWCLFQEKLDDSVLANEYVLGLAKEVARMCGGLPLALITVARAMAGKRTQEEWRHARTTLRDSPVKVKGMEDKVFSQLKFSYDCLQDDAKPCFLYCSYFPESSDIRIEVVISYWIGEGYFDGIQDYNDACDKGHDVIGSLKMACLLESIDEDTVKMHDVVREMALWVASEFGSKDGFLFQSLISEQRGVEGWKKAERAFLNSEGIRQLPESPDCPNLLTLILRNTHLRNIPDTFFQHMPDLRVLDLRMTGIYSLPQSFLFLENLRYLNLSNSPIRELPMEFGRLIKLQYLNLSFTYNLEIILDGIILMLSGLKWLSLYGNDFVKSEELQSLKHLAAIEITLNDHIFQNFFDSAFLLEHTKALEIRNCDALSEMLFSLGLAHMVILGDLTISSCLGLSKVIIGSNIKGNFLCCLKKLLLSHLPNLIILCEGPMPHGSLPNLRYISISYCTKLKNLGWIHNLPNLQITDVQNCKEMEAILGEDVVVEEGDTAHLFPKLHTLYLQYLPKLKNLYHHQPLLVLPSLKNLHVFGCPLFKRPQQVLN